MITDEVRVIGSLPYVWPSAAARREFTRKFGDGRPSGAAGDALMVGYLIFGLSLAAFAWPVLAWCRLDSELRRAERRERERATRRVRKW